MEVGSLLYNRTRRQYSFDMLTMRQWSYRMASRAMAFFRGKRKKEEMETRRWKTLSSQVIPITSTRTSNAANRASWSCTNRIAIAVKIKQSHSRLGCDCQMIKTHWEVSKRNTFPERFFYQDFFTRMLTLELHDHNYAKISNKIYKNIFY